MRRERSRRSVESPLTSRASVHTTSVVRPITACRECAGLMTLDVTLDMQRPLQSSRYACPHCGATGAVTLPGAVVRTVEAVAAPRPIAAIAS